jgi:hypothetical protein
MRDYLSTDEFRDLRDDGVVENPREETTVGEYGCWRFEVGGSI